MNQKIKSIAEEMVRAYSAWQNRHEDSRAIQRDPIMGDYVGDLDDKEKVIHYILKEGKTMLETRGFAGREKYLNRIFVTGVIDLSDLATF